MLRFALFVILTIVCFDARARQHAGLSDTTTLMAVAPQHVRAEFMLEERSRNANGVSGDPSGASIELGEIGMNFLVDAATTQIKEMLGKQD